MGSSCLFEDCRLGKGAPQRRAREERRSFVEVMAVTLALGPTGFRGQPYAQQMTLFL
jgi:hypothetical protein